MSEPELVHIRLLGTPSVVWDGKPVHLDTRKAIALLAYLAVADGPHSRDETATLLWPESDTSAARGALRRTLSSLRAAVGHAAVASDRRAVWLDPDRVEVDLIRFRRDLSRVRAHGHRLNQACVSCLPILQEATRLYQGDLLSGFSLRDSPEFDDWHLARSTALRRDFGDALEGAARSLTETGELQEAIEQARPLVALDPLHESAHRLLMELYDRAGQRAAAIQQYRECVRMLDQELAVVPVEETTLLYHSIKEGTRRETEPQHRASEPVPSADANRLPLVGRRDEWESLLRAFDQIQNGPHVVVVEGEAGIGKTRLLEDLVAHARANGTIVLSARCYEGETGLAYGPVMQLLRGAVENLHRSRGLHEVPSRDLSEAGRLIPDLVTGQGTGSDLQRPGGQTQFLEGLSHLLLAAGSKQWLILGVDDLQWADTSSLECLAYLMRRLERRRVGIVLAWRPDETESLDALRRVVAEARVAGRATILELKRLDRDSVLQLVDEVGTPNEVPALGSRVDPERGLGEWLYEETEGLPLFLGEYIGALSLGSLDRPLPQGIRDLLLSRIALLSETGAQFLTVAAVIGRSFDFDTLRDGSGRDEEMTVAALEELVGHGLVRELAQGSSSVPAYDFNHDKLRALVYERTGLARKRLLHRRVAEALSNNGGSRDASHGQIAQHYQLAGMASEAATYFQRAGEHAQNLFANHEALGHFEAALALGHEDTARLQESLGDVYSRIGEYPAAVSRYEAAAALTGGPERGRVAHKLGTVHDRWGEWDLAETYYEEAVGLVDPENLSEHARIQSDWSLAAYHRRDPSRALRMAETAYALAEEGGDALALAEAHNTLGIVESSLDHGEAARGHLLASLTLAEQLSDPMAKLAAFHNLAIVYRREGELAEAIRLTSEALKLSGISGDRHREAALHNAMADLLHESDEQESSMEHLRKAVMIYAEIGVDSGVVRPEVWKLSEW